MIGQIDLNALIERVAEGTATKEDADALRAVFMLRAQMHVCAEALTAILAHGEFIRKHFSLDLRAEVGCALLDDAVEEEEARQDAAAAAILEQLDQAHSEGEAGDAPCG